MKPGPSNICTAGRRLYLTLQHIDTTTEAIKLLLDVIGAAAGGYAGLAVGTGAGWMTEEFELLGISFKDRDHS